MKITKIGHCCFLIEVNGRRIMTDPGSFTVGQHELERVDIVLFTHEHSDHLHIDSLKKIVDKNPEVTVIANSTVGKLLEEARISYEVLEGTDAQEILGVLIEAFDAPHAEVFENLADVHNTGYFIAGRFYYPGDAYSEPGKEIELLGLPVAGPWCKLGDAIHYALTIKPKIAIPFHDGLLNDAGTAIHHRIVGGVLAKNNIEFRPMKAGDAEEF